MFGWLKKKNNKYIPQDIDSGMMTSFFTSIKLNEKIDLPSDITGFVAFKDKLYATLPAGTNVLSKELLVHLCEKQAIFLRKTDILNVDLFFVNSKDFDFSLTYIDKVPIQNKLAKIIFDAKFQVKVQDEKRFYSFVTSMYAGVNANQSNKLLCNTIEEFLRNYFLHKKLSNLEKNNPEIQDLNEKLFVYLQKIGVELKNFDLIMSTGMVTSIQSEDVSTQKSGFFDDWNKRKTQTNQTENSSSDSSKFNSNNSTQNLPEENTSLNTTMPDSTTESNNILKQTTEQETLDTSTTAKDENICPVCKTKFVSGSIYCHICGYKRN